MSTCCLLPLATLTTNTAYCSFSPGAHVSLLGEGVGERLDPAVACSELWAGEPKRLSQGSGSQAITGNV